MHFRGRRHMLLTRDFKETIRARAGRDPEFRRELLCEGVESLRVGDVASAMTILFDLLSITVGPAVLSRAE